MLAKNSTVSVAADLAAEATWDLVVCDSKVTGPPWSSVVAWCGLDGRESRLRWENSTYVLQRQGVGGKVASGDEIGRKAGMRKGRRSLSMPEACPDGGLLDLQPHTHAAALAQFRERPDQGVHTVGAPSAFWRPGTELVFKVG